jgi:hypothetical protein
MYQELKKKWKKYGRKGAVRNYSNVGLWVLETDTTGHPVARILRAGYKTPKDIDFDGFKRIDGKAIQGHRNWWKFYDFSTVEVFKDGRGLRVSVIAKRAVKEKHFGDRDVKYLKGQWGSKITVILDIKKNNNRISEYLVSGYGWLDFETTLRMTCYHEIDNARPVFPKKGKPYIRSKRDKSILNNFSKKGKA